ncbi:MAG: methionine--tRNA ligase [Alphaproteobacteria bacterium]
MSKKFYLTTAIPYSNGAPHIGHAYEAIATDTLARFKRLDGYDVFFLTGMDDHGQKIHQTAHKENIEPQQLVDQAAAQFNAMRAMFHITHDDVLRTTEPRHKSGAQEFWRRLAANGDIYLDKYAGWYSVRDEAYFQEEELTTVDGERRAPSGAPVTWMVEESYFFKLSAYQDRLLALYEAQPDFIGPDTRRNEIISFVKSGLKDISISRTSFDWGVQVPDAPKHVMYVWVDALSNYITALGYPKSGGRMDYWPCDVHMIGKDIIRFHAVYWPAFLMAAGLPLPKCVFAHGFIYNRGEKMSKSVGNVITPEELATRYGVDQVRYFLMREIAYGQDGNISHETLVQRINSDLANGLGNLAQRSLSMIAKNCDGKVPDPGQMTAEDHALRGAADALLPRVRHEIEVKQFHRALETIWSVVSAADRYIDEQAPWALKKTDQARMGAVLYHIAEVVRRLAILAQPFMPLASAKLLDQLAVPADQRQFTALAPTVALTPGTVLPTPQGVFPRFVESETEQKTT